MVSIFPRPQQPNNVPNANNMIGAMRGDGMSMLRLIAQRNPNIAGLVSQLDGMSQSQVEERAQQLMQNDPRFAELVKRVRDNGFMQAARSYGLNI